MKHGKIAYLMSRFPHLPETFILREMLELVRIGWEIEIYPLIVQNPSVIHPQVETLIDRVHRMDLVSARMVESNLKMLLKRPGTYISTAWRSLWENRFSLKFLLRACVIFPKSVMMAESMQEQGIQHVHAHYATHPALAAWIIHRLTGIPYSITCHAHDIFVEKSMLRTKASAAAFLVAISEFNRRFLTDRLGEEFREKIQVIRCGIFPEDYHEARRERQAGKFIIISTGSLQPYKGQRFLIEACALLKARQISFRCLIIGGGDLFADLSRQITASGLADYVEILGSRTQEDVSQLLSLADCYVQPSIIMPDGKMEGIPIGLMEAMISGLPVIATRISGIPELVLDDRCGLLVPPEDPGALACAIEKYHRHPDTAEQFARKAKEHVGQEYDLHKNICALSTAFMHMVQTSLIEA